MPPALTKKNLQEWLVGVFANAQFPSGEFKVEAYDMEKAKAAAANAKYVMDFLEKQNLLNLEIV